MLVIWTSLNSCSLESETGVYQCKTSITHVFLFVNRQEEERRRREEEMIRKRDMEEQMRRQREENYRMGNYMDVSSP